MDHLIAIGTQHCFHFKTFQTNVNGASVSQVIDDVDLVLMGGET